MKTVVENLKALASDGKSIIDDVMIKELIGYLVDYYNLSSYVKTIKTQYFPIKPGTKILYDIKKMRIEYFMWPIIKESEELDSVYSDEYNRLLYVSLNLLVQIRCEIEHIIEIYLKSDNRNNFENSLLNILLRVYKLYLNKELREKDSRDVYTLEKIYQKNVDISPVYRLAYYEAYNCVLGCLDSREPVKHLLERDYENLMDQAYRKTDTPTLDYIKNMYNYGLISCVEEDYLIKLSALESNAYKYGLILPK